jgi:hypothetical protein
VQRPSKSGRRIGVYDEIGHPEWAEAIYEAYFKSRGIPFY